MQKTPDTETHIGLIAQEVQAHWPEIAKLTPNGSHLSLDYGKMTAILVQAIKELRQEIRELKGEAPANNPNKPRQRHDMGSHSPMGHGPKRL